MSIMNPPPIPPHSEISGINVRHRNAITPDRLNLSSVSRRDPPPIPARSEPPENRDKQREFDEMKARVTQMEKTLRWWSECTSDWRKKWAKVKEERNEARLECKNIKSLLEKFKIENGKFSQKLETNMTNSIKEENSIANGNHQVTSSLTSVDFKDNLKPDNENYLSIGDNESNIFPCVVDISACDVDSLGKEIEKLRLENTTIQRIRDLLVTDKILLEKENTNLKADIDLASQSMAKLKSSESHLTQQLEEKNNELIETRSMLVRLKKAFIDRTSEMDQLKTRNKQNENETTMLRNRVEELKKQLTSVETQLDIHVNEKRKSQRINEDLLQQNESLKTQITSFQSKLRRMKSSVGASSLHNAHDIASDEGSIDCNDVD